jgi:hypothetical protein
MEVIFFVPENAKLLLCIEAEFEVEVIIIG